MRVFASYYHLSDLTRTRKRTFPRHKVADLHEVSHGEWKNTHVYVCFASCTCYPTYRPRLTRKLIQSDRWSRSFRSVLLTSNKRRPIVYLYFQVRFEWTNSWYWPACIRWWRESITGSPKRWLSSIRTGTMRFSSRKLGASSSRKYNTLPIMSFCRYYSAKTLWRNLVFSWRKRWVRLIIRKYIFSQKKREREERNTQIRINYE